MLDFALIGYPVSHSGSPELYRREFGGACRYDLIGEEDFNKAWERFLGGYDAVNVTAPFKERAFRAADVRSAECESAKAANLIIKTRPDGLLKAFNTDVAAVRSILRECGARSVLVVGNGGAGRAAAVAAKGLGLKCVCCNRTVSEGVEPLGSLETLAAQADTIVYAVPVPVPGMDAFSGKTVIEANYRNPSARIPGCRYIGGEEWLRRQAQAGFSILRKYFYPAAIVLSGFMGSGKSSVGKLLAGATGRSFIDLDTAVSEKYGAEPAELIRSGGEQAFREMEFSCLEDAFRLEGKKVIALGGGTLFAPGCAEMVRKNGLCVYLQASSDCVKKNLGGDWTAASRQRPLLCGCNPEALLETRLAVYESSADITVKVDGKTLETISAEICDILTELE